MSSLSVLRVPTLVVLFATAAVFEAMHLNSLSSLANADIWWHLRVGQWIAQNHALPHSGLFSQSPQLGWISPSWGYDLKIALAYRFLGLRAIPILLMGFKTALAVVTFLLAGGFRGKFWPAVVLSVVAQYVLGGVQPAPVYCSILLFAIELFLLLESFNRASARLLFWLPPLFLVWANLDMQFVYGIGLLLLFVLASFVKGPTSQREATSSRRILTIFVLSVMATIITPYGYHLYVAFFSSVTSAANHYFPDFRAMTFHQPQDYLLLLLTMTAFLTLGLRRSRDAFQITLLVACTALSFYSQRNIWLVTLAAVAVIGQGVPARAEENRSAQRWAAAGFALLILTIAAARIPHDRAALLTNVGQSYPVAACDYIRDHNLPQPLFNAYEWGGFVMWYLPEYPVAIDARPSLYNDDFVSQYSQVMNADLPYSAYPAMANAGTLLLPKGSLLGEALGSLPVFKVAYSDGVSVVLQNQQQ